MTSRTAGLGYDGGMPPATPADFASRLVHDPRTGFTLDTSGLAADAAAHAALESRFPAVFDAMDALESGAVANPDEGRRVGHYWLRHPDLAPDAETAALVRDTVDRVEAFSRDVRDGRVRPKSADAFLRVLVVGIGGSALGPMFCGAALRDPKDPVGLFVADNTDPDGLDRLLAAVGALPGGLAATLVVVISKSGGTKETRNGMLEVKAAFAAAGLDFAASAVAVTGVGSELDRVAAAESWLARFPMWDWVGGRTSVTSAVGLLPLALVGVPIRAFLDGAARMDAATRTRDPRANLAARLATAWFLASSGRGAKDMVLLPYKDRLELLGRYLQQLVMESLGKELDTSGRPVHQGLSVYGNKGSTDQHAYVQQLRDGVDNFFVLFVEVLRDRDGASIDVEPGVTSGDYLSAFLQGTRRALHDRGRETVTLTMPDAGPASVGALIALFERATGYYATLVGINAYHQPGVEAGKKAAASVLALRERLFAVLAASPGRGFTVAELCAACGSDDVETVFMTLRHAAANGRRGVEMAGLPLPSEARFLVRA